MVQAATAVERAGTIADDLLFPTALDVDAGDLVPAERLDLLADAGLYGAAGPTDAGGLDLDQATMRRVVATLAGGCLTTAFVWLQHHGSVRALAASGSPLRSSWLPALCSGERRAAVAIAGIRPGATPLRAAPAAHGWTLTGDVPWVTGWRLVDVVYTAALAPGDEVVWLLVDAVTGPTLTVERQRLVAADASDTVTVSFAGHAVPAERLVARQPYAEWRAADAAGLRTNGSLAIGVACRCCRLLGPTPLDAALARCRTDLEAAAVDELPAARAGAARLAMTAAEALVVATGSRAVLRGGHAQRLAREAMFLLVFGSRPAIRARLLETMGATT